MTKQERARLKDIKNNVKYYGLPTYGCMFTIEVEASVDYKKRVNDLYTGWDMHPASVREDTHYFDGKERIIYIKGRSWTDDDGKKHSWTELYTSEEKRLFEEKLSQ